MRLNKFLSRYGVCSRREADRAIEDGRVRVNENEAVLGQDVDPQKDEVYFDGKRIREKPGRIVIAYNKPAGIVCSTVSQAGEKNDVISAIGIKDVRIFPIGRLDKDSTGLLLLTNDGEFCDRVLRGINGHEKEYIVRTDSEFTEGELEKIRLGGIPLEEKRSTRPCRVRKKGRCLYDFILTEGMNRQIRRVCEVFGKKVISLERIRFMNITLGDLQEGSYRVLKDGEIDG